MRLLVIADDDSLLDTLPEERADLLISCGDLANETILKSAARCGCERILAVKGNHDSSGKFPPEVTDLHLNAVMVGPVSFGGFAGAWRYKPRGNYLFEQQEVNGLLKTFPSVDIFVAHNSPRGIHDREDDVHHGFEAFGAYLDRAQPLLFLHGHQHLHREMLRQNTGVIGTYGWRMIDL